MNNIIQQNILIYQKILKYMLICMVTIICLYKIPNPSIHNYNIIIIGLIIPMSYAILDMISPSIKIYNNNANKKVLCKIK